MQVEIWSDMVCPWCYIGKQRFERALARFAHADEVTVIWRSYQLDPNHPKGHRVSHEESLSAKMGRTVEEIRAMNQHITAIAAEEGLQYDFDRYNVVNTWDAHRLAHLAKEHGLSGEVHERLLRAQLVEGEVLDDDETLIRLVTEVGVPEEEARRVLAGDDYSEAVVEDIRTLQALGGSGVPFFVIDRRYGISGAQPVEMFLQALEVARNSAAETSSPNR